MDTESDADYYNDYYEDETLSYVAYNVVASIIITIGILGNVVGLGVLTRPNMKVRILHTIELSK